MARAAMIMRNYDARALARMAAPYLAAFMDGLSEAILTFIEFVCAAIEDAAPAVSEAAYRASLSAKVMRLRAREARRLFAERWPYICWGIRMWFDWDLMPAILGAADAAIAHGKRGMKSASSFGRKTLREASARLDGIVEEMAKGWELRSEIIRESKEGEE